MVLGRGTKLVLAVVTLLVAGSIVGLVAVDRPRIQSVDNEWGEVTSERTEVQTHIVVENPFLLRVGDAIADVSYTVSLNNVTVASERKTEVALSSQQNTVNLSTWIDNDEIPRWFASHINRNETTTVRINPNLVITQAGREFAAQPWSQTRTVETDILEPFQINQSRELSANGRTLLVVNETSAEWGTATSERTPIDASVTVTNPLSIPVPLVEISYTIRMNGIVVGEGVAAAQRILQPESTETLDAQAVINNTKLDKWWVTHVRNDETTQLSVDFNASLGVGDSQIQIPVELATNETFQTDIFQDDRPDTGS